MIKFLITLLLAIFIILIESTIVLLLVSAINYNIEHITLFNFILSIIVILCTNGLFYTFTEAYKIISKNIKFKGDRIEKDYR